ncbi:IclR family transcriptional regulator [Streptococcus suis]|nr:IclR family transcriptional regulator [Streptococcus suis]
MADHTPIQAIVNAIKILDVINEKGASGTREIAKLLNIPKSTVFRILKSLEDQNLIISTSDDKFAIGYKLLDYRVGTKKEQNLIAYALPYLKDFAKTTQETINLAIPINNKSFVIHSEEGEYYTLQSNMLPEADFYCSSTGKIFLADMTEADLQDYFSKDHPKRTINTITDYQTFQAEKELIRRQKIAYDNEEYEYGLTCLATPIMVDDKVIAAISVSGPTTRLKVKDFSRLEKQLQASASMIEKRITSASTPLL